MAVLVFSVRAGFVRFGADGTAVASASFMRPHTAACLTVLLAIVGLLVGACGSATSEDVGSTAEGVASGDVYNFGAIAHSGSCLDARGGGTADGTQIQEWTCNGTGAQSFELEDDGVGALRHRQHPGEEVRRRPGERHRERDEDSALGLQPRPPRRPSACATRAAASSAS